MNIVCIKIGGSTLDTPNFFVDFGKSIANIAPDYFPVIIHGGGKDIAKQLDLQKKEYRFIEGMRVTDADTVGTVQMVLSGDVNKRIVNALLIAGVNSLGISGVDCNLLSASKMTVKGQDIGFVGQIDKVDKKIIDICKENRIIPVISPISRDAAGNIYNVNADLAASEIAKTLSAAHLVFVSDVPGVRVNNEVRHKIGIADVEQLINDGHITGGMIPKVRGAKESVESGVSQVHICGWHGNNTLRNELTVEAATGTIVCK